MNTETCFVSESAVVAAMWWVLEYSLNESDQYQVRARKVGVAGAPQSCRSISGRMRVVSRSQEGPSVTLCDRYGFIKITSRGFSVAFKLGMQTSARLKAQAPTKETRAVSVAHVCRRARPPLFPVLTGMTRSEKVVKERKPNPERLGKYISAGIFLPADRRIFFLPAFQAKRHDSAVASNAPVKSSLPSELSLLPELAVQDGAGSGSALCSGVEEPTRTLTVVSIGSTADTTVPETAPSS